MQALQTLSLPYQINLFVLLALMGLFALLVLGWHIMMLKGQAMKNPNGLVDDRHEQSTKALLLRTCFWPVLPVSRALF